VRTYDSDGLPSALGETETDMAHSIAYSFGFAGSRQSQREAQHDGAHTQDHETSKDHEILLEHSADTTAELSFDELHFSLNDEEKARIKSTEKSHAQINIEDKIKLSSLGWNSSFRIRDLKESHHEQQQVLNKKATRPPPLRYACECTYFEFTHVDNR